MEKSGRSRTKRGGERHPLLVNRCQSALAAASCCAACSFPTASGKACGLLVYRRWSGWPLREQPGRERRVFSVPAIKAREATRRRSHRAEARRWGLLCKLPVISEGEERFFLSRASAKGASKASS